MDDNNPVQPPANDPYAPLNQPTPPVPGSGVPGPQLQQSGSQPLPSQPAPQPPQPSAPVPPPPPHGQPASNQRPPLRIDHNLLAELGLAELPDEEKKALEKHIYETLEMRVGMRLADQMTNEQLDEFETYFNARDDAGAFRWLETNFPNYKDIVADEFDKLKGEVAGQAPAILSASQQQTTEHVSAPAHPAPEATYQQPAPGNTPLSTQQPQQPMQQPPTPSQVPPVPPQWPESPAADQQPPQAPTQ